MNECPFDDRWRPAARRGDPAGPARRAARPRTAQIFKVCGDVDDNDVVSRDRRRAGPARRRRAQQRLHRPDLRRRRERHDHRHRRRDHPSQGRRPAITRTASPTTATSTSRSPISSSSAAAGVGVLATVISRRNETFDNSFECENGEDGLYEVTYLDGQQDSSFSDCFVDNAVINGDVENANDDPLLAIELADARNEDTIGFEGTDGRRSSASTSKAAGSSTAAGSTAYPPSSASTPATSSWS